jgi:hypothetical protein
VKIELYRRGKGWLPASEDAEKVLQRMDQGEICWVKPIRVRDPDSHRRYWKLMQMCADNCEQIELPNGAVMRIHSKDDVHTAIKFCSGHVTTILDASGNAAFQIPKSTDYESMTKDEWDRYWPSVIQVVMERVMPGIERPEIEFELQRCMGLAR